MAKPIERTIAIVIPYTKDGKILLQERKSISKWGEEWSFWGGGVEKRETKEAAAKREIREELEFEIKESEYLGKCKRVLKRIKTPYDDWELTYEIFATKVKEDLSQFKVHEGDNMEFVTMQEARRLVMAPQIDNETLDLVEKFLRERKIILN
ncbi:MAG: NUDIX hydrolase [Nanoarchaeota archaeon]